MNSSDIGDLFIESPIDSEDILSRLKEAKELDTPDYRTLITTFSKLNNKEELFDVESKIITNSLDNLKKAISNELGQYKPNQLLEITKTSNNLKRLIPEELKPYLLPTIKESIPSFNSNNKATDSSHNKTKEKLNEAFNNKTTVNNYYSKRGR